MRSLAEFIMRGRWQAATVAFVGGLLSFPPLSQASLGLVSLRKGATEGALVTLSAIVPWLLLTQVEGATSAVAISAVLMFATYLCALVLRNTGLWSLTLGAVLVTGGGCGVVLTAELQLDQVLSEFFSQFLKELEVEDKDIPAEGAVFLTNITVTKASGIIASMSCWFILIGLFLARWFQAMLYNPGGFQSEFHAFRLSPVLAVACLIGGAACQLAGEEFFTWVDIVLIPVFLSGFSLLHFFVKRWNAGIGVLMLIYASAFIVSPLLMLLAVFGFTDAWVDYRNKFKFKQ